MMTHVVTRIAADQALRSDYSCSSDYSKDRFLIRCARYRTKRGNLATQRHKVCLYQPSAQECRSQHHRYTKRPCSQFLILTLFFWNLIRPSVAPLINFCLNWIFKKSKTISSPTLHEEVSENRVSQLTTSVQGSDGCQLAGSKEPGIALLSPSLFFVFSSFNSVWVTTHGFGSRSCHPSIICVLKKQQSS